MYIRTLIALLVVVASCRQFADRGDLSSLDSDSLKNRLADSVDVYYLTADYDGAARYLERIADQIQRTKNVALISSWWRIRSKVASEREEHDSALAYIQQANRLTAGIDSLVRDYIFVLIQQGYQAAMAGNIEAAIGHGQKAFEVAKEKSPRDVTQAMSLLMRIFSEKGDWPIALRYGREALACAQSDAEKLTAWEFIGLSHMNMQAIDSGLHYYRLSVSEAGREAVPDRMTRLHQIATLLLSEGVSGDAVSMMEQAISLGNDYGYSSADLYSNMAELYWHNRQFGHARRYMDSAILHGKAQGMWDVVEAAFHWRAVSKQQEGDLTGALAAKDSVGFYHRLADSVAVAGQLRELDTRYQVQSKDEHIASISAVAAAQRRVSQQRAWTIGVLVVAGLLAAGLGWTLYRRRRMQLQIREYELHQQLLRSQMEDHFIYNALSNLQYLIRSKDHDNALGYLGKFAKLIHLNQFNSKNNYVPLTDEVHALEAYLALQRIHTGDSFTYHIDAYEGMAADGVLIPPMLLQPFVENAVVHGVQRLEEHGQIRVRIDKLEMVIRCRIEDNGPGHAHTQRAGNRPSQSTVITRQRLEILGKRTGKKGTLHIERGAQGQGTVVILDIPFR